MMQKTKVAIGLGCNLGNRLEMLKEAALILKNDILEEARSSSVYETAPWGIENQPPFLNAVLVGQTEWKSAALINFFKNLEVQLGRTRTIKNGPRELDVDLLAYGEHWVVSDAVTVPHPGIAQRDFVLVPFFEVWPDWIHPITHSLIGKMLEDLLKTQENSARLAAGALL